MPITSLYALPLVLLLIALAFRVINYRRSNLISLGDQGDPALLARTRAHANCAEYLPLGLIAMALAETAGAHGLIVHATGMALLVGRLLHAYALSSSPQVMSFRVAGMVLTFTSLVGAALTAALLSAQRLLL
ncbi:MAG: MAPEG family protein [Alphaproteobacteria bacterium]|nr:MAPEG family protein [Alphaproteobacteria bacterium]